MEQNHFDVTAPTNTVKAIINPARQDESNLQELARLANAIDGEFTLVTPIS